MPSMFGVYVIRIKNREDRARAIWALLKVREPRQVYPGNLWGVTEAQVEALKREGIPFEDLTDVPPEEDGKKTKKTKTKKAKKAKKPRSAS
jgi:hypothetical protein